MKSLLSPHWAKLESLIDIEPPQEVPSKFTFTPKKPIVFEAIRSNVHVAKNWSAMRRSSPPKSATQKDFNKSTDFSFTSSRFMRPVTTEGRIRPKTTSNRTRPVTTGTRFRPGTRGSSERPGTNRIRVRPGTTNTRVTSMIPKEGAAGFSYNQLHAIYNAKCQDLRIPNHLDQERRFLDYWQRHLKNRRFSLCGHGLGPKAASLVWSVLVGNQDFAYLDLSKNGFGNDGIAGIVPSLAQCSQLCHLNLTSNDLSSEGGKTLFTMLSTHDSIQSVDVSSLEGLHRNKIGLGGAKAAAHAIVVNPILAILNISGNSLGYEGINAISDGVKQSEGLLSLDLSGNDVDHRPLRKLLRAISVSMVRQLTISSNNIGDKGCDSISNLLDSTWIPCQLQKLDISRNDISYIGGIKLWKAIKRNSSISHLNLEKNPIESNGLSGMVDAMIDNCRLQYLNMSYCELGHGGLKQVGEALIKNYTLKELVISNNYADDIGAKRFAVGLAKNHGLELLDLSQNRIRQIGGVALGDAFLKCKAIKTIILKDNALTDSVGQILSEAAQKKRNITCINLQGNQINKKYLMEIAEKLTTNREFNQKLEAPALKKNIEHLQFDHSQFAKIDDSMARHTVLKEKFEVQLEQDLKVFSNFRDREMAQTSEVEKQTIETIVQTGQLKAEEHALGTQLEVMVQRHNNQRRVLSRQIEDCVVAAQRNTNLQASLQEQYNGQKFIFDRNVSKKEAELKKAEEEFKMSEKHLDSFKQQCENLRFINETLREKIAKRKERLELQKSSYDGAPHLRERLGEKDKSLPPVPEIKLFRRRRRSMQHHKANKSRSRRLRAVSAKRGKNLPEKPIEEYNDHVLERSHIRHESYRRGGIINMQNDLQYWQARVNRLVDENQTLRERKLHYKTQYKKAAAENKRLRQMLLDQDSMVNEADEPSVPPLPKQNLHPSGRPKDLTLTIKTKTKSMNITSELATSICAGSIFEQSVKEAMNETQEFVETSHFVGSDTSIKPPPSFLPNSVSLPKRGCMYEEFFILGGVPSGEVEILYQYPATKVVQGDAKYHVLHEFCFPNGANVRKLQVSESLNAVNKILLTKQRDDRWFVFTLNAKNEGQYSNCPSKAFEIPNKDMEQLYCV